MNRDTINSTVSNITKYLQEFIKQTSAELLDRHRKLGDGGRKFKFKVLGPILETMSQIIMAYTRIIPNYSRSSRSHLKPLVDLRKSLEKRISELGIDGTSLIGVDQISFPRSSRDEVFIGYLNKEGVRSGHGSLTNGEIIYKGNWSNDKKNGFGVQVYDDGYIFEGHWEDDVPQNGRWTLGEGNYFYGKMNRTEEEKGGKEWMVGFTEVDKLKQGTNIKLKNILYWKGKPTNLKNISIHQQLDIDALVGGNKEEDLTKATVQWLHGVEYFGPWKNFKPRFQGLYKFPDLEVKEIKVLSKPKFVLCYKSIECDHNVSTESGTVYNRIKNKYGSRSYSIEFKGGVEYDGGCNVDYEFEGLGTLYADEDVDLTWIDGKSVRTVEGLFSAKNGFLAQVLYDDEDPEEEKKIRLLKASSHVYFKDRDQLLRLYRNPLDLDYDWITMKGRDGTVLRYRGGWKDLRIDGPCQLQINDGKVYSGAVSNGLFFNANINMTRYKELKGEVNKKNIVKIRTPIVFRNGSIYKGGYNMETETFDGFGNLIVPTEDDEIELKGLWKNSKLIIDKTMIPKAVKNKTLLKLKEGEHSVVLTTGHVYKGIWENYQMISGEVILPDRTVEPFDPKIHQAFDHSDKEAYESRLVLFDWNKFVYNILGTHQINLKILFTQQQNYLKPLIDYEIIRLVHEQEYRKDDRTMSHYNEFPRVDLHVRKGEFNIDHLLRREALEDESEEEESEDDEEENEQNIRELKDDQDMDDIFKNLFNQDTAFFKNTDFTVDINIKEQEEKQKEEEAIKEEEQNNTVTSSSEEEDLKDEIEKLKQLRNITEEPLAEDTKDNQELNKELNDALNQESSLNKDAWKLTQTNNENPTLPPEESNPPKILIVEEGNSNQKQWNFNNNTTENRFDDLETGALKTNPQEPSTTSVLNSHPDRFKDPSLATIQDLPDSEQPVRSLKPKRTKIKINQKFTPRTIKEDSEESKLKPVLNNKGTTNESSEKIENLTSREPGQTEEEPKKEKEPEPEKFNFNDDKDSVFQIEPEIKSTNKNIPEVPSDGQSRSSQNWESVPLLKQHNKSSLNRSSNKLLREVLSKQPYQSSKTKKSSLMKNTTIQRRFNEDLLNDDTNNKRSPKIEITYEGLLKTTVEMFSQMKPKQVELEYGKSLLNNLFIRESMFLKHNLNGIAEVNRNSIIFFNGDRYIFQNSERGFMHSLGTFIKHGYNIWNGKFQGKSKSSERNYYWSIFFSKIEFTNFDDHYFDDEVRGKLSYDAFSNFNNLNFQQSDGTRILGSFLDCKLLGFAKVINPEPQSKIFNKSNLLSSNTTEIEQEILKTDEQFWFNDSLYAEIKDLGCLEKIKKKLREKPTNAVKYSRLLYNLLTPIPSIHKSWSKKANTGFEAAYFMIDFPEILHKKVYQDWTLKYEGIEYKAFGELIDAIELFKAGQYEIYYPNGDIYIGQKNNRGQTVGNGEYRWATGYTFEGEFNLNIPFGNGVYRDCLGNTLEGFFINGLLLSSPYGLDKMVKAYRTKIKKDTKHDLDILLDARLMDSAFDMYMDEPVVYDKVFIEMRDSLTTLKNNLQMIKDGEKDYYYNWSEKIYNDIRNVIMNEAEKKVSNIRKNLWKSFRKKDATQRKQFTENLKKVANENKERKSVAPKSATEKRKAKVPAAYHWITKISTSRVSEFQQGRLIEIVNSGDMKGTKIAFDHFFEHKSLYKFFSLTDSKDRNLLMITMYFGYMTMFVDMLSALNQCYKMKIIKLKQIESLLRHRDYEGNNLVDLGCIRGYNVKDKQLISLLNVKRNTIQDKLRKVANASNFFKNLTKMSNINKALRGDRSSNGSSMEKSKFSKFNPFDSPKKEQDLQQNSAGASRFNFNVRSNESSLAKMKEKSESVFDIHDPTRSPLKSPVVEAADLNNQTRKQKKEEEKLSTILIKERKRPPALLNLLQQPNLVAAMSNDSGAPKNRLSHDLRPSHQSAIPRLRPRRVPKKANTFSDINIVEEICYRMDQSFETMFTKKVADFENLYQTCEDIKFKETDQICFITDRGIILNVLFHFCGLFEKKITIFKKKNYNGKKNNPLHYAIHKADLHASIALLKEDSDMAFWRNEKNQVACQMIKYSGSQNKKSTAVFASLLNEITRQFNFTVLKTLFFEEIENPKTKKKKPVLLKKHYSQVLDSKWIKEANKERQENDQKDDDYQAEKWWRFIKKNKFDGTENYLYLNNYILLSDELCEQFLGMLKESTLVKNLRQKYTLMSKHLYDDDITILDSLQRNFLDYYKGGLEGYHDKKVIKKMQRKMKQLLTWYVYLFGEVDLNPEIYTLMQIDPFERVLDGKNIFHFICENNSYNLLSRFLTYLYERCHSEPYDRTRKSYKEWDKTLIQEKHEEFLDKLTIKTLENQQTPAHLCAIYKSYECLELLIRFNVDIQEINLRGITVSEIITNSRKNKLETVSAGTVDDVPTQIFQTVREDILISCKRHSLTKEFIPNCSSKEFNKIFDKSKYELNGELKEVRWDVRNRTEKFTEKYKRMVEVYQNNLETVDEAVQLQKLTDFEKRNKLSVFRREYLTLTSKKNLKGLKGKKLFNREQKIRRLQFLMSILDNGTRVVITMEDLIMNLFQPRNLERIKHFKYKKLEKLLKKGLHKHLRTIDFGRPVPRWMKDYMPKLGLFCVQLATKEGEQLKNNIIFKQIWNIKNKHITFDGGIDIQIIKGFDVSISKPSSLYLCSETKKTWFLVIDIKGELLMKYAYDYQMEAFNMKDKYHTVFSKGSLEEGNLEPLSHSQKIYIMTELIKDEFDLEAAKARGEVLNYFPVHDHQLLRLLRVYWRKHRFLIHFLDLFTKTKEDVMKVMSLISAYHGVQHGFYFGFLSVYTNALFLMAVWGTVFQLLMFRFQTVENSDYPFVLTPLIVGIWSTVFMNYWKKRETELSYTFDVYQDKAFKEVRDNFKGQTTIDEDTMKISKKYSSRTILTMIYNVVLLGAGIFCTVLIYQFITDLLKNVNNDTTIDGDRRFLLTNAYGALNSLLNFILSLIYNFFVDWLVYTENHTFEQEYRNSLITKKIIFKVTSSIFTLVAQTIIDGENISSQILSNLVTSAILDYGLSVIVPILNYQKTRYHYFSHIFSLRCLCCKKRKGKIEEFKKNMIYKMLSDDNTKLAFERYCLKDGVMEPLLRTKVEKYKEIKKEEEEKKDGNKDKKNQISPMTSQEEVKAKKDKRAQEKAEKRQENRRRKLFKGTVNKIENVHQTTYEYKPPDNSDMGINKKKNIKLRLRENFTNFMIGKETIIESSYMIDLNTLEEEFYTALITQFSFICFFSPYLITAGLISWVINLVVIFITVSLYTDFASRSISRRSKTIGVWNVLFNLIGYLGVVYNTAIVVKNIDNPGLFYSFNSEEAKIEVIYFIQAILLILKYLLSITIDELPNWIQAILVREKLNKQRSIDMNSQVLNRLIGEATHNNQSMLKKGTKKKDNSLFEKQEGRDLKFFFKNDFKEVEEKKLDYDDEGFKKLGLRIKVKMADVDD